MKNFTASCATVLAAATLALGGCDQGPPTGPPDESQLQVSPQYVSTIRYASVPRHANGPLGISMEVSGGYEYEKAIKWSSGHRKDDYEVDQWVGIAGGTISISKADFTLTIPPGALSKWTRIEIKAEGGNYVEYDMKPHGLTFKVPVTVTQGLKNTEAYYDQLLAGELVGAYLVNTAPPTSDGSIVASEFLTSETFFLIGTDGSWIPQFQTWKLDHFSRYMLASG